MTFSHWWSRHRKFYVGVLGLTALSGMVWSPNLLTQLFVLLSGVLLIGIAHGSVDYRFGRELLEPATGYFWVLAFTGIYLTLGFLTLAIWLWSPRVGLAFFLLLAVPHFGFEDVRPETYSTFAGPVVACSIGTLPIVLPAAFSPAVTTKVFNFLLPEHQHLDSTLVADVGQFTVVVALGVIGVTALLDTVAGPATIRDAFFLLVEAGALTGMFWLAEPILAFTVYYCIGHSSREMLEIMDESYTGSFTDRLRQFFLEALPIAAATVVIGILSAYLLAGMKFTVGPMIALIVFVGLSVVLLPHMLFDLLHEQYH